MPRRVMTKRLGDLERREYDHVERHGAEEGPT